MGALYVILLAIIVFELVDLLGATGNSKGIAALVLCYMTTLLVVLVCR